MDQQDDCLATDAAPPSGDRSRPGAGDLAGAGRLSRRGFLGAGAAGSALLLAAPGLAEAAPARTDRHSPTTTGAVRLVTDQPAAVFLTPLAVFRVYGSGDTASWTLRDVWGATVGTGRTRLGGGRGVLLLPVANPGHYTVQVQVTRSGQPVGQAMASLARVASYHRPTDTPFGANTHLQPPSMVPVIEALGISWIRTDLTWTDIEPPPLAGWSPQVYQADASVTLDPSTAHTGTASVKIVNSSPKQDNYYATVAQSLTVQPATTYTFTAWVKGQNVSPQALQFTVAGDWGNRVDAPSGTFDWTKVSFQYTTGSGESALNFRLLCSDTTGAGWMDDVSVVAAGSSTNIVVNPGFEQGRVDGYTFDTFTPYLNALARAGINPLPILDYANPKYDDGQTPYDDAGRAAFAAYTTAVMTHWKGRFRAVEVYNEYNAGWFTTGPASADPNYYAALLASTYTAVKAVDPSVAVVGGVTYGTALDWLTAVFEAGGMQHMDVISNHPYTGAPESAPGLDVAEQQVAELIKQHNGGVAKPVWVSELGWSLSDQLVTAGYLVRGLVLTLAGGVEKFFWYDLVGDQNFGLLNQDGDAYSPRPVFTAYANAIRVLTGRTFAGHDSQGDGAALSYRFTGKDADAAVLWSTQARSALTVSTTQPVTLVDVTGTPRTLTPVNGEIYLTLTGSPVYLLGRGLTRRTDLLSGPDRLDVSADALVTTAAGSLPLTYTLDNSTGRQPLDLTCTTAGVATRLRARPRQKVQVTAQIGTAQLSAGRNTLITWVTNGRTTVGRLVTPVVVVDVPAGAIGQVGTVDWKDTELALASGGYAQYAQSFPNDVAFTLGTDDPATAWPYIHPGPDDGWAGSRTHAFTLSLPVSGAPTDLQLVVFLLDTHNTAPGTVAVAVNGQSPTEITLPAGGGVGYDAGDAMVSGDQPTQFAVALPAAQLHTGTNTITITKTTGSWMVYDAVGVYPA